MIDPTDEEVAVAEDRAMLWPFCRCEVPVVDGNAYGCIACGRLFE